MTTSNHNSVIDIYVGILDIKFEDKVKLRIIANCHGTKEEYDRSGKKQKNFDENSVLISLPDSYSVDKYFQKLKEKGIKGTQEDGEKNFSSQIQNFWEELSKKYKITSIKGIDIPLKEGNVLAEDKGIRIRLVKDGRQKKSDNKIKIFERCAICLSETATYDVIVEYKDGNKDNKALSIDLSYERLKGYITPFATTSGGASNQCYVNFQGSTFFGELILLENKKEVGKLPILVFPTKLEPEEAEKIINELIENNEKIYEFGRPTALLFEVGENITRIPIQTLLLIKEMFNEDRKRRPPLGKTLRAISLNPDKIVKTRRIERYPHEVSMPDVDGMMEAITSGNIAKAGARAHFYYADKFYAFTRLEEDEAYISYDTYPNRFLKFFLRFLKNTANLSIDIVQREIKENKVEGNFANQIINEVRNYILKEVEPFLMQDWMNDVQPLRHIAPPSQKLLKDTNYSSAFFDYLDLIRNLKLVDEEFEKYLKNPITWMPELYELWCGLKLKELTEEDIKYQEKFNRKDKDGWHSYSLPLMPDFVVYSKEDLIIFDAKYRVDFVEAIEELTEEKDNKDKLKERKKAEKIGEFKDADLYKMHTYREAIVKKDGNGNKRPLWVIALYPGDTPALFCENGEKVPPVKIEITESNELNNILDKLEKCLPPHGGVGAIPFRPSLLDDPNYKKFICDLLKKVLNKQ
jgi:hypothetical protein